MNRSRKIKKNKRPITGIFRVIRENKLPIILLFLLVLISSFVESIGLALIMPILDLIMPNGGSGMNGISQAVIGIFERFFDEKYLLLVTCIGFFILIALKNIFIVLKNIFTIRFTQNLALNWAGRIKKQYLFGDYSYVLNNKQGKLIHNIIAEPNGAAGGVLQIIEYSAKIILAAALVSVLIITDWKVSLAMLALFGVIFLLIAKRTKTYSEKVGRDRIKYKQDLNSQVSENISGILQLKLLNLENSFFKKFIKTFKKFQKLTLKFKVLKALPGNISEVLIVGMIVGGIIIFNYALNRDLAIIISMIAVFIVVMQRLKQVFSDLISNRMAVFSYLPSISLVYEIIDEYDSREQDNDKVEKINDIPLRDAIYFNNVSFGYNGKQMILKDFSLKIPANKTTGLQGESGIGKSTLINLLTGLYTPNYGSILINGIDLRNIDKTTWLENISVVSQDPFVFHMSIKDNILMGNKNADENAIIAAAETAGAHVFIQDFPNGYDTIVGDRGATLSGGQRQRITIARALIRDPKILIFDEATSALDDETEKGIQNAVNKLKHKKTIIIIAHRKSTLKNADVVYNLNSMVRKFQ